MRVQYVIATKQIDGKPSDVVRRHVQVLSELPHDLTRVVVAAIGKEDARVDCDETLYFDHAADWKLPERVGGGALRVFHVTSIVDAASYCGPYDVTIYVDAAEIPTTARFDRLLIELLGERDVLTVGGTVVTRSARRHLAA